MNADSAALSALLLLPPFGAWLAAKASRVERYETLAYLAFAEWVGCNVFLAVCAELDVLDMAPVAFACVHMVVLAVAFLQPQTGAVIIFELLVATAVFLRLFHAEQGTNTVELANYAYVARCLVVIGFAWYAIRLQRNGVSIDPATGRQWYERDAADVQRELARRRQRP